MDMTSSETQGKLNLGQKIMQRKAKNKQNEPLGTAFFHLVAIGWISSGPYLLKWNDNL